VIDALLLAKVADRMYHARAMIIKKMVYMDGNVVTATGATIPPGRHILEIHTLRHLVRVAVDGRDDMRV
jgi:hypothetical protein